MTNNKLSLNKKTTEMAKAVRCNLQIHLSGGRQSAGQ